MIWLLMACSSVTLTSDSSSSPGSIDSSDSGSTADTGAQPQAGYTGLSTESGRTCVLTPTGTIACFDATASGWSRSQDTPAGLYSHVSAGGCGIKNDAISCWDPDEHGTAEPPVGDFATVERGTALACAPDTVGALTCWGDTGGLGTVFTETRIEGSLSVSGTAVCGLAASGALACDGAAVAGAPEGDGFAEVAVGGFGCALDGDGVASCWGAGAFTPEGRGLRCVSVGNTGACALDGGTPVCSGTGAFAFVPEGLPLFETLTAGDDHVCGLDGEGVLTCWLAHDVLVSEAPQ